MFFIFGNLWDIIMVKAVAGTLKLAFKITWFAARTATYLGAFLILSAGAGIAALARRGQPEELAGAGEYSQDATLWLDQASGSQYPCHQTEREHCEVQVADAGMYWRKTVLSRLMRGPAVLRDRFSAVSDASAQPGTVAASADFPREARHNITVDHLDPATASSDPYGLTLSRGWATSALAHLDDLLAARGWQPDGASGVHWYSRTYERPVILWDQPVQAAEPPAIPAPAT